MISHTPSQTKRLIIRLSSLGDVILSTSALSALEGGENHWIIAREYAGLVQGHPKLKTVWEFDRAKGGLFSWLKLCGKLWDEGFTEVLDLHSTLRSKITHLYFLARAKKDGKAPPVWKTVSKERAKLYGLFTMKRFWPKRWYPTRLVARFALLAGGSGNERPNLEHLLQTGGELPRELKTWIAQHPEYLCVMPSSKWNGKKWGVRGFFEVISKSGMPVVVLGEKSDRESALLVKMLEQTEFPHFSGIGKFGFPILASILSQAQGYFGNDTGLGHLAEAVGTRVVTVFGPTIPEMGFGPWRAESRSVGVDLWCKPCGKDGRFCYRFNNRYACQTQLKPAQVLRELTASMDRT